MQNSVKDKTHNIYTHIRTRTRTRTWTHKISESMPPLATSTRSSRDGVPTSLFTCLYQSLFLVFLVRAVMCACFFLLSFCTIRMCVCKSDGFRARFSSEQKYIQKSNKNDNDDLASLLSRINYYHKSIARFSPPLQFVGWCARQFSYLYMYGKNDVGMRRHCAREKRH